MGSRYRDEDWLEQKYRNEGLTQREIAEKCGVSPRTIRKWMNRHDIETREVRGKNHGLYGQRRDEATKRKISETLENREIDEAWRERIAEARSGKPIPEAVREKISESLSGYERPDETRERMSLASLGPKNARWKGHDSTHLNYGAGWGRARRLARERDEVCQHCGHGGDERRLEVHHIVPVRHFRRAPDTSMSEAHALSNLVLLCSRCHGLAEGGEISFESGIEDPLYGME